MAQSVKDQSAMQETQVRIWSRMIKNNSTLRDLSDFFQRNSVVLYSMCVIYLPA